MKNLVFVIWMLGWPLVRSAEQYVDFAMGLTFTQDVRVVASLIALVIWAYVGLQLYEPEPKKDK